MVIKSIELRNSQFIELVGEQLCRPRPGSLARRFQLHLQQIAFLQDGIRRGIRRIFAARGPP